MNRPIWLVCFVISRSNESLGVEDYLFLNEAANGDKKCFRHLYTSELLLVIPGTHGR